MLRWVDAGINHTRSSTMTVLERAEFIREKGTNRSRYFRGEIDKYTWVDIGSSYLPSDILAAFLFAQLEKRDNIQEKRKMIWETYYSELKKWAEENNVCLPFIPNYCEQSYHLFYLLFDIMLSTLPKPNLLIYLHADIQCLQKNIKKRDRTYEQNITDDYLLKIQKKYLDFFKKQNDFPVLIIDVTNADFVQNDSVYQKIVSAIKKRYSIGVHQLSL